MRRYVSPVNTSVFAGVFIFVCTQAAVIVMLHAIMLTLTPISF